MRLRDMLLVFALLLTLGESASDASCAVACTLPHPLMSCGAPDIGCPHTHALHTGHQAACRHIPALTAGRDTQAQRPSLRNGEIDLLPPVSRLPDHASPPLQPPPPNLPIQALRI